MRQRGVLRQPHPTGFGTKIASRCYLESSIEYRVFQHYKRDADGLCHRLVTPIICENYRIPSTSTDIEDRTSAFLKAGLVIPSGEIRLGDIIGHGEFGGMILLCLQLILLHSLFSPDVLVGYYKDKKVAVKVSKRHGNGLLDSLLDESRFMVQVSSLFVSFSFSLYSFNRLLSRLSLLSLSLQRVLLFLRLTILQRAVPS